VDTIEIRIDDHILDTILTFINQASSIMRNETALTGELKLYRFEELATRIEEMIQTKRTRNAVMKYIKNLRVEPIEICFTFRSSPGHSLTTTTKNLIGDFGLTLASIDQAKIKLS